MSTTREHPSAHLAARLAVSAAVFPAALLLPATAVLADGGGAPATKAQVEHAERLAAPSANKAQIEHAERTGLTVHQQQGQPAQIGPSQQSSSGTEVWQLAASAAAGALVTGVGMVAVRRLADHHQRALAH